MAKMTTFSRGHDDKEEVSPLMQIIGATFDKAPFAANLPKLAGDFATLSDERGVWACRRSVRNQTVLFSRRPQGGFRQIHRGDDRPQMIIETTSLGGVKVSQFAYVQGTLCCLVSERTARSPVVWTHLILNASDGGKGTYGIVVENANVPSPYTPVQMEAFRETVIANAKRAKVRARKMRVDCVQS